jgi:hypothetical protein
MVHEHNELLGWTGRSDLARSKNEVIYTSDSHVH